MCHMGDLRRHQQETVTDHVNSLCQQGHVASQRMTSVKLKSTFQVRANHESE
jgi:hypothetical protein